MIEIVFSGTAYGELLSASSSHPDNIEYIEQGAKEFGNGIKVKSIDKPEGILLFEFQWDIGYLDKPEDSEYRMKLPASLYYAHHVRLHPEDEADLLSDGEKNIKSLKALKILAEKGKSFRIWHGSSAMEMCGYYYICNILKDFDVEVYTVELPSIYVLGDKVKQICSWGMVHGFEIGYLSVNQKLLSTKEISYIASMWRALVEENTPLRVVISNRIISVPEDFYDAIIIGCFEGSTMKENEWISEIMSLQMGVVSGFVEQRIWEMGKKGLVTLMQDGEEMSERIWKRG